MSLLLTLRVRTRAAHERLEADVASADRTSAVVHGACTGARP